MLQQRLESSWNKLVEEAGLEGPKAKATFDDLITRYSEDQRAYHNLTHIDALLHMADEHADEIEDRIAVGFAIWFHDAIYEVDGKTDNEGLSAELARATLIDMGASEQLADRVSDLVKMTKTHAPKFNDTDAAIFLDFDMSILAEEPAEYQAYAANIRKEYGWVPDEMYNQHRAEFLETTLQSGPIFKSSLFGGVEEAAAKANMAKELQALQAAGQKPEPGA